MPSPSSLDCDLPTSPLRAELLRRAVGTFGLLLVAVTWPLWTPQDVFPQVPLFRFALAVPLNFQWLPAAGMLTGLLGMALLPRGRWSRFCLLLFAGSVAVLIVFDQQRLQPWAYQFAIVAVVLATCQPRAAILLLSLFIIGFYFQSALTKLDYSFLHTLGQQFLEALARPLGISVDPWSPSSRLLAAVIFPAGELLVAVGLYFAATRRIALAGAVLLHLSLLVILGPWGLGHRPGVLLWNVYFIVQDLLLFSLPRVPLLRAALAGEFAEIRDADVRAGTDRTDNARVVSAAIPKLAMAVVLLALLMPALEPWGVFDMWPSWGLYAPSAERVVLQVHRSGQQRLPAGLAEWVESPEDPDNPWLTVRLDRWALETLGAPIYPQARVQLGVALEVAEAAGLAERGRIIRYSRADRWTGKREYEVLQGIAQAQAASADYVFNSQPRMNVR